MIVEPPPASRRVIRVASIAPMTAPARSVVFCMRAHRPTRRRCRRSRHPTAMPHAWSGVTRRSAFRFSEPAPTRRPALLRCRCDACGRRLPIHSHSVSCGDFHVYPSLARESVRTRYRARSSHRKHRPRDRRQSLLSGHAHYRRSRRQRRAVASNRRQLQHWRRPASAAARYVRRVLQTDHRRFRDIVRLDLYLPWPDGSDGRGRQRIPEPRHHVQIQGLQERRT